MSAPSHKALPHRPAGRGSRSALGPPEDSAQLRGTVHMPAKSPGNASAFAMEVLSAPADKREVYRLRYRAYREAGWVPPSPSGQLCDDFDLLPSTLNLAASRGAGCIGALRLVVGREAGAGDALPCEGVFPSLLAQLQGQGYRRPAEFSRLAIDPTLPNRSVRATLLVSLVREGVLLCHAADVDYALVAVHERVSRFHQMIFGFEYLGSSEAYIDIDEPTHLLGRSLKGLDGHRSRRSAFFDISPDEIARARATIAALGFPAGQGSGRA